MEVGLTVKIQLRFEISPRYCGRGLIKALFLSLNSFFFVLADARQKDLIPFIRDKISPRESNSKR